MISIFRIMTIFILFIFCWQALTHYFHIADYLLPAPLQIAKTLLQQRNLIIQHMIPTLLEVMLGFLFGVLLGCSAGLAIILFKPLQRWFLPALIISQAIPSFTLAPLLVVWFGFGLASKIIMSMIMIFFPVASSFYDGLRKTNSAWLELISTMNASCWRSFYHIRIPAALPALASGIRIAAVAAPIGAIVGEWVGSSQGLGYLMITANARMQIDLMFAALVMLVIMALALYFSIDQILRRLVWW